MAGAAQQGTTTAIRHQADYDPEARTWHLIKMIHLDGGAFQDTVKLTERGHTKNIFDALHWCSEFQAFSEQNSTLKKVNPDKKYSHTFKHWRTVAKDMRLPIAKNGVLVLPEAGRAIPDGHYNGDQVAAAYEAGPHAMPAAAPPAPVSTIDALSRYNNIMAKGDALARDFETIKNNPDYIFGSSLFLTVLAVSPMLMVLPTFFLYLTAAFSVTMLTLETALYASGSSAFSERCLNKHCTEFNQAAALLPDPQDRALCEEFIKQAQFEFWTTRAAGKSIEKGLPLVQKAGESLGLDGQGIDRLQRAYIATHFKDQSSVDLLKIAERSEISWGSKTVQEASGGFFSSPREKETGLKPRLQAAMQKLSM